MGDEIEDECPEDGMDVLQDIRAAEEQLRQGLGLDHEAARREVLIRVFG